MENRRIIELIREIEQHALSLREVPPQGHFAALDAASAEIELPLQRPLFSPPHAPQIDACNLDLGESESDAEALFDQVFVDRSALRSHIRRALQTRTQVSVAELVAAHPLSLGLAELVAYLAIAAEDADAVIDNDRTERVQWIDGFGTAREATMPVVLFVRGQSVVGLR